MYKKAKSLLQKGRFASVREAFSTRLSARDVLVFFENSLPMRQIVANGDYARLLFWFSLLFSAWNCYAYLSQPILEWNAHRQTQTALTSYWLLQNGFSLAYWTPVVGQGWSIPFEFPIYQWLVAIITKGFGTALTDTGRAVSWAFSAACSVPLFFALRRLGFDRSTRYFALALFMACPLYVFWASSFTIESTALFLVLCFGFYAVKILDGDARNNDFLLAAAFLALALLQKVTTALPIVFLFLAVYCIRCRHALVLRSAPYLLKAGLLVLFSLSLAYAWVSFSDSVKAANPIGAQLTSRALQQWNYGTLEQRFSLKLWRDVIWNRFFVHSMYGWAGVAVLAAGLAFARQAKVKAFILLMMVAGFAPLFVFTNLHIWHAYYQCANLVFVLLALAAAAGALGDRFLARYPLVYSVLLFLFVLSSMEHFSYGYLQSKKLDMNAGNHRVLAVSSYVKAHTRPEQTVIWYGLDWSSSMAFYSERKSLTVPDWPGVERDSFERTERYLQQPATLAVVCPGATLREKTRAAILQKYGAVRTDIAADCTVYFLQEPTAADSPRS